MYLERTYASRRERRATRNENCIVMISGVVFFWNQVVADVERNEEGEVG